MTDLFRTTYAGGVGAAMTLGLAPLIAALSIPDPKLPDPLIRFWARSVLKLADVHTEAEGLSHVPERSQFILVVNHQSHFDVLLLVHFIERHLRFVAKADLFRIPIFGQALKVTGNLKVERDGGPGDRSTLQGAVHEVQTRVNIVFFAEGTRSEDGVLRPFKKGAAALAVQAQVPILPAAVAGTRHILPKGSRRIHGDCRAALVVGAPIATAGKTLADVETLTAQAHAAVATLQARAEEKVSASS